MWPGSSAARGSRSCHRLARVIRACGGWLALAVGCAACSHKPAPVAVDAPWTPQPEHCAEAVLDTPGVQPDCTTGSGSFGEWFIDDQGLPAYRYRADQHTLAAASWFNTEGRERRDHWFALGNDRLNVLFANDGTFEVVTQDRGVTYLNKIDEAQHNFGGGFSFVDDGEAAWCTAYKWRPTPAATLREQHVGWSESATEHNGLRVAHRVFAPPGRDAVVIDEVTVSNTSGDARGFSLYEYWDVARRNIAINWLVSGIPFGNLPSDAATARDALNQNFDEAVAWDAQQQALVLRRQLAAGVMRPDADTPDDVDWYPGDPFLAQLAGAPVALYWDQSAFFAATSPAAPAQLVAHADAADLRDGLREPWHSGAGQTRMLMMRSDLQLAAGTATTLRYVYGYTAQGAPVTLDDRWKTLRPEDAALALQPSLPAFATPGAPHLTRELAWHAAQLEMSKGWRAYQDVSFVPQGSAYLYLHGADGAARDIGLFALPLTFTDPPLARSELKLFMQLQFAADKRFSYAFQGHGQLDNAMGFHSAPSDLDLTFLWAMANYVGATGDTALLDEKTPYWPKQARPDATGWDHVHDAARHLLDVVGMGPHGLVRVGTGDWNDGILQEAPDRLLAVKDGESVPNSQQALYVLPLAAALLDAHEPALAAELRSKVAPLCEAVKATWTGEQFGRAYFGDGVLLRPTEPDLEATVWALIGDCFQKSQDRATLVERARARLDMPSPAGALLREKGQVWPAISALLTWGYARSGRDDLALAHLARNTMAMHAVAYPDVWSGIWSGPDGLQGPDPPAQPSDFAGTALLTAGESWYSPVTPMTDFPVQNNNQHAMPLWAMIKMAGVETLVDGLELAPHLPQLALRTALLDLDARPGQLTGTWRPTGQGARRLVVHAPVGTQIVAVTLNGEAVSAQGTAVTLLPTAFPAHFAVQFAP